LELQFSKYQGTGNDFVIIDNRNPQHNFSKEQIIHLCDRKFGIGSDGLILIQNYPSLDFEMVFYNPDASQSFCGNGSRCAVVFAKNLGLFNSSTRFLSTDGEHQAELLPNGWVKLKMHDVNSYEWVGSDLFINTGSPHYILPMPQNESFDIVQLAHGIRYNDRFAKEGVNVNFIKIQKETLHIRTYERGVEDETLSCGTGVTAAALAQHIFSKNPSGQYSQQIQSQGGELRVSFEATESGFSNIHLEGPAMFVYKGLIEL
jgi:diaminopimelate epimerase